MHVAPHLTLQRLYRTAACAAIALVPALPQVCVAATAVSPGATIARAGATPTLPEQGLYEGCALRAALDTCTAHLGEIRNAGFHLVLNYSAWYGSAEEALGYADAAQRLGLELIWPLNHPAWARSGSLNNTYPDMAESLVQPATNAEFIARAVSLVAAHPATWGFYIGDEVAPAEATSIASLSAAVRDLAPRKPQLYVARPGAALLEPFAAFADVTGIDSYPIGSGDPAVGQAARTARAVASAAGIETAMVLQAFSWSQYRSTAEPARPPNVDDLRAMRDAAIRHADPGMILWYSYQDILRSKRPRQRWCALIRGAFLPALGLPDGNRVARC